MICLRKWCLTWAGKKEKQYVERRKKFSSFSLIFINYFKSNDRILFFYYFLYVSFHHECFCFFFKIKILHHQKKNTRFQWVSFWIAEKRKTFFLLPLSDNICARTFFLSKQPNSLFTCLCTSVLLKDKLTQENKNGYWSTKLNKKSSVNFFLFKCLNGSYYSHMNNY